MWNFIEQEEMRGILLFYLLECFYLNLGLAQQTGKWGDQGNGTFRNPIIAADYSDPDPIRVGDDYYMAASTFEDSPGVHILHSKDLVNWTQIGGVFQDLIKVDSAFSWNRMKRYNEGVYAPSLRFHAGKFWIFVNFYTDGFWMATADNPKGPWEIHIIKDKYGKELRTSGWTDPCPFWDEDGKAYLASSHPGAKWYGYLFEMSPDGRYLLDADFEHMKIRNIVYQYPNGGTLISPYHSSEGNKIYKRNGYYYLIHIEFLEIGQGQGTYICRSKHIYGTKSDGSPGKPGDPGRYEIRRIDQHNSEYIQSLPGQGGLVDTPNGDWFWIAQFNKYGSDGRTPCLLPVTWIEDWPVIGGEPKDGFGKMVWECSKPIPSQQISLPQGSDEFNTGNLNARWAWNHQPHENKWSLSERPGYLRLYALKNNTNGKDCFFSIPNVIHQRHMRSDSSIVTVKMDISRMVIGQKAGLANFNGGISYSLLEIEVDEQGRRRMVYSGNGKKISGNYLPGKQQYLYMRSSAGFDDIQTYKYSLDGKNFISIGECYLLRMGNYRGNMIGVFTYNNIEEKGYIDIDWFNYQVKNK